MDPHNVGSASGFTSSTELGGRGEDNGSRKGDDGATAGPTAGKLIMLSQPHVLVLTKL